MFPPSVAVNSFASTVNDVTAKFGNPDGYVLSYAVIVYDPPGVGSTVNVQLNVPVELTRPDNNRDRAHDEKSVVGFDTTDVIVAPGSNPCPLIVIGPFPTNPDEGLIVSAGFTLNGTVTATAPSLPVSCWFPSAASPTVIVHAENDPSAATKQLPTTGAEFPWIVKLIETPASHPVPLTEIVAPYVPPVGNGDVSFASIVNDTGFVFVTPAWSATVTD